MGEIKASGIRAALKVSKKTQSSFFAGDSRDSTLILGRLKMKKDRFGQIIGFSVSH